LKISTKGRYGLRAVLDIALHDDGETPVSLTEIAERQYVSVNYLEQLMTKLKKANIVKGVRGAQGGYHMARPADEISVGEVLRALEGSLEPVDCAEIMTDGIPCEGAKACVTKFVWKRIGDAINDAVDHLMLSDLVDEGKSLINNEKAVAGNCVRG